MVKSTRTYRRTRRVFDIGEITIEHPEFYDAEMLNDLFRSHAKSDPEIVWTPDGEEFSAVSRRDDDDEDERTPVKKVQGSRFTPKI